MIAAQTLWRIALIAVTAATSSAPAQARIGPSLRELVEVVDIESLSASPNGRELAFRVQRPSVSANSYRIDWYVADIISGAVRRVADGGAPIYTNGAIESEAPVWSPDSQSFYRRALVNGAIGIWRTSVDRPGNHLIVGGPANVESLVAAPDGQSLVYVTGPTRSVIERAERKEYDEGILVDASIDPGQAFYRGGWERGRLASERLTGEWYSRAGLLWREPRVRHRLDLRTLRELSAEAVPPPKVDKMSTGWKSPAVKIQLSSGDDAEVVGTDADQHVEITSGRGARIICNIDVCRGAKIVALVKRPGTQQILFTRQDPNYRQTLYLWDFGKGEVRRIAGGDGQLSGGRSESKPCIAVKFVALCVEANSASPPRLVQVSFATGSEKILYDPNSTLRSRPAPQVEQLTFNLDDGRVATGTLLYRPGKTPTRAPLFVTYYFCPGYLRGGTGDPFPLEPLVDSGFVVACLNAIPFKVWGDYPDHNWTGLASVSGLIGLLNRRGWIDPARVGMGGLSMGSEVTMWVAVNSKLLSAAAVVSPQYEPANYWSESVRGRDVPQVMKDFEQAGSPDKDPERWKVISPALNTDRIKAPLLMQLPEQEVRAAMELYSKLSNSTTPVEMYGFPDEAHIKIQPRHQFSVYKRNLEWFRYWLQGYTDPDPALAQQYQRWADLRERQKGLAK